MDEFVAMELARRRKRRECEGKGMGKDAKRSDGSKRPRMADVEKSAPLEKTRGQVGDCRQENTFDAKNSQSEPSLVNDMVRKKVEGHAGGVGVSDCRAVHKSNHSVDGKLQKSNDYDADSTESNSKLNLNVKLDNPEKNHVVLLETKAHMEKTQHTDSSVSVKHVQNQATQSESESRQKVVTGPDEKYVLAFFKKVLMKWRAKLDAESESAINESNSISNSNSNSSSNVYGSTLSGTADNNMSRKEADFLRTSTDLAPLVRELRKNMAKPSLVKSLRGIVALAVKEKYREAFAAYLTLSIGKEKWLMGPGTVGIHERSSRDRISKTITTHLLDNPQTKHAMQAVKRILTIWQELGGK